jgi:hypothetical protein
MIQYVLGNNKYTWAIMLDYFSGGKFMIKQKEFDKSRLVHRKKLNTSCEILNQNGTCQLNMNPELIYIAMMSSQTMINIFTSRSIDMNLIFEIEEITRLAISKRKTPKMIENASLEVSEPVSNITKPTEISILIQIVTIINKVDDLRSKDFLADNQTLKTG